MEQESGGRRYTTKDPVKIDSKDCEFFYFSGVDFLYHKIGKIEEAVLTEDDKLFLNPDDDCATLRNLSRDGYFEAEFSVKDSEVQKIFEGIDKIYEKHKELSDLMWICEFAKRYLKEHMEASDETSIKS